MYDFNHDGKIDTMDYALYDEINRDDSSHRSHKYIDSGIGNRIWGFVALIYLSVFLNGSIGFGLIRLIIGVISVGIILVWIGGGLS